MVEKGRSVSEIVLSCGRRTVLDIGDYLRFGRLAWHATMVRRCYYVFAVQDGATVYLDRLILGAPKELAVKHENGDGFDNRRQNISIAVQMKNTPRNVFNPTGFRGVLRVRSGRFRASISTPVPLRRCLSLGTYRAAFARFGQFARLNFPHLNGAS